MAGIARIQLAQVGKLNGRATSSKWTEREKVSRPAPSELEISLAIQFPTRDEGKTDKEKAMMTMMGIRRKEQIDKREERGRRRKKNKERDRKNKNKNTNKGEGGESKKKKNNNKKKNNREGERYQEEQ